MVALTAAYRLRLRQMHAGQKLLEQHHNEITALNDCLMKAQEEERARIAGELHDGVLQQITSLSLMLGTFKRQPDSEAKKAEIGEFQKKLIQVGTDIRQLPQDEAHAITGEGPCPPVSIFSGIRLSRPS